MKLKNAKFAKDMRPLDEGCTCRVCQQHTRSYLHHAIKAQGVAAPAILITYHNVAYMQVCRGAAGNRQHFAASRQYCRSSRCRNKAAAARRQPLCGQRLVTCACGLPYIPAVATDCSANVVRMMIVCVAATCLRASAPQGLARRLRAAIKEQRLPEFVRGLLAGMFPDGDVPQWVVDALDFAGQASRRFSSVSQSLAAQRPPACMPRVSSKVAKF